MSRHSVQARYLISTLTLLLMAAASAAGFHPQAGPVGRIVLRLEDPEGLLNLGYNARLVKLDDWAKRDDEAFRRRIFYADEAWREVWTTVDDRGALRGGHAFEKLGAGVYRVLVVGDPRILGDEAIYFNNGVDGPIWLSERVELKDGETAEVIAKPRSGEPLAIHVVDSKTRRPIGRVEIEIADGQGFPIAKARANTNVHGEAKFTSLSPGKYFVKAKWNNPFYSEYAYPKGVEQAIAIEDGKGATIEIALDPAPNQPQRVGRSDWYGIEGRVTDEDGKPLEGVTITCLQTEGTVWPKGETLTGPDGRYTFRVEFSHMQVPRRNWKKLWMKEIVDYGNDPWSCKLYAGKDGYHEKSGGKIGAFTTTDPQPKRIDFVMVRDEAAAGSDAIEPAASKENRPLWVVEGKVTDADGNPMEGVVVDASAGWHTLMPTGETTTGADGRYRLHFGPGRVRDGGENPESVTLQAATIYARKDGFYEKNLCRGGGLMMAGRLENGTGMIANVLPPGSENKERIVLPGQPRRLDFVMLPAARVSGRFIGTNGRALEGIRFSLDGPVGPSAEVLANATTGEDGRFEIRNVPTKRYSFKVWKNGYLEGNELNFARPGEYRIDVVYDRSEGTIDYRILSTPAGISPGEVLNPESKSGSGAANVIEHEFTLGEKIATPITMGTVEWPKVLMIHSVEFTRDLIGGTIRGKLMLNHYSYPKMGWRISIELLDEKGNAIARKENTVQTGGEIIGRRLLMMIRPVEFAFGGKLDVKKIRKFRVRVEENG